MTTITIDRAVVEQALDDLKDLHTNHNITYAGTIWRLEAALAQEQVEPAYKTYPIRMHFEWVGGQWLFDGNPIDSGEWCVTLGDGGWMIYPAPPQRKPLTDEEIIDATEHIDTSRDGYFIDIARAVERAHGIGDNP